MPKKSLLSRRFEAASVKLAVSVDGENDITEVSQNDLNSKRLVIPSLNGVEYRINKLIPKEEIDSIRVRHIALSTEMLAHDCRLLITKKNSDFAEMAKSISLCESTKASGGDAGWIDLEKLRTATPHFLPSEVLNAGCSMNKGDVVVVKSSRDGAELWHVVQLMDVVTRLSPVLMKNRLDNFKALRNNTSALTYSIETMGCQMNTADSERIAGQLNNLGYSATEDSSKANIVIFNTCSIRDHAEQKVYSHIGPHALRKRKGDDVSIIVAGCVAQQEGDALIKRFPEVDIVMGPQYANRVSDLLENVFEGNQVVATDPSYQTEDSMPALRKSDVIAFVNVIYGCNERCTYCVVPTTRGVEQSRTKDAIVGEIQSLVAHGYKEVTLLGQNIDSWGRDMSPKQLFADLLKAVAEVPGIERVRFLTSHPKYMSPRVIEAVAQNRKLCPCFNIPFQSGDDTVLRNMRRGYTVDRYLEIVGAIRERLPDAAITADCIVGFPGETEEQFQKTLELMEKVQFEQVNTAAYSPRPNTPAADWQNQVSEEVKADRLQRINRLGNQHALNRSLRFVGRVQEVLVEDVNLKYPSQVFGRNEHSRLVYFDGSISELKGKLVKIKITEARPYSLTGEMVDCV